VADATRANFLPPVVTVVGGVVALRSVAKWAEKRPLFGVRAAVTRPQGEGRGLADELSRAGADVWLLPTISVHPRKVSPELRREFRALGGYQWVVFTSANAVRIFFEMLADSGHDARSLAGVRVAAMGDRTAEALRGCGIAADAVPPEFVQESLAAAVPVEAGDKVLIPRASDARQGLEQDLVARGAEVHVLPIYDTAPDPKGIARLRHQLTRGTMNLVTFTSASTFLRFAESVKEEDLPKLFADVAIASIGPETSRAVRASRLEVAIEATRHTTDGLAEEILSHYRRHHGVKDADTSTKG
jgi:uroporphyrinogen III methyltransferase/synthase